MKQKEFEDFLDNAIKKAEEKQIKLYEKYRIHDYADYIYDDEKQKLQFKKSGRVELEFEVTCIGSWNSLDDMWLWAWGNTSIDYEMREKSRVFRELYYRTRFSIFVDKIFHCTEFIAYETTCLAIEHAYAMGMFKIKNGNNTLFLCINRVVFPEETIEGKIIVN